MAKKRFISSFPPGSAQYVIAHATWQRSRGRNPSLPFLTERDPKKALADAQMFAGVHRHQTTLDSLSQKVGDSLSQHMSYADMDERQLEIAVRGIVTSSSSEEEIRRRLQDELGCPEWDIMLSVEMPTDQTGFEARELVKTLGGLVTANGAMVMCEVLPGMADIDFSWAMQ